MGTHPIFESDFDCLTGEMAIESANYLYAVIFAAGAYITYRWFWAEEAEEQKQFNFKPMDSGPLQQQAMGIGGDIISRMKAKNRNILILYGSQTGTAEDFATTLAKEAQRYEATGAMTVDPEDIELEDLVRLNELEDGAFDNITFAVFGLGNKTYENYNTMGKYFDKRMNELGGERLLELGLGDDDANIEEDFNNWKVNFWQA